MDRPEYKTGKTSLASCLKINSQPIEGAFKNDFSSKK